MLNAIEIKSKTITADALLTQRDFANYLAKERKADYPFTVKGNQPTLLADAARYFNDRKRPDFIESPVLAHGRIDTRRIWVSESLNDYLNFPYVGQIFAIERESINKNTGKVSIKVAYAMIRPVPPKYLRQTESTGELKIIITLSTEISMRIEARFEQAMAQRIVLA